jgi:trypsin
MVRTKALAGEARLRECSGVIVAPQLVLTAGHCVCHSSQSPSPKGGVEQRVAATSCAETAIVTVFFYEQDPRNTQQIVGSTYVEHRGKVRPHPALVIRLDARQDLISSHADLAVIHLETPVPPGFRAAQLARTSAVPGETLTRVGFGYDETLGALDGRRLVQKSRVLKALAPADGRFLLEDADGYTFRGDSGGPCFRETRRGPELVGISTTGLGQDPTMTSLLPYSEWLRDEISSGASTAMPPEPGTPR